MANIILNYPSYPFLSGALKSVMHQKKKQIFNSSWIQQKRIAVVFSHCGALIIAHS